VLSFSVISFFSRYLNAAFAALEPAPWDSVIGMSSMELGKLLQAASRFGHAFDTAGWHSHDCLCLLVGYLDYLVILRKASQLSADKERHLIVPAM